MPDVHALLSPSSAYRWIECTPSAVISKQYPDNPSTFALEGTLAHTIAEALIKHHFQYISKESLKAVLIKAKKSEFYCKEMLDHCKGYLYYVVEVFNRFSQDGDTTIKIEQTEDMSVFAPGSFGTLDIQIYNLVKIAVIDFKYGKGKEVSAVDNPQLKMYGLGVMRKIYDKDPKATIQEIEMHIYQPRKQNFSCDTQTREQLARWAKTVLIPAGKLAARGEGEFKAGYHCDFCLAKGNCITHTKYLLDGTAAAKFALPNALTEKQIEFVVTHATLFESWIKSVKSYALEQAQKGYKFKGLKIVMGRSNRYIESPQMAAMELSLAGIPEKDIYGPKTLNAITDLEKRIGPDKLYEIIGDYIKKPDGAPTLVSITDNRQDFKKKKAVNAFNDLLND